MIVCNWKMFGNRFLVQGYVDMLTKLPYSQQEVVVCPPFPFLNLFPKHIVTGGQNCHQQDEGAFTGEVSAKMLQEMGCQYVLLGHSERRQYCGETHELVTQKAKVAMANHIKPIVCIGSKLDNEIDVQQDIHQQLSLVQSMDVIVAYEPLWAIGTDKVPSIQHIQNITAWIKTLGFNTVLYGGSVSYQNAAEIYKVCDGLLIGRAALDLDALSRIMDTVRT